MTITAILVTASSLLAAIGGAAGLTAFFKIRPERQKIYAEAWRAGAETENLRTNTSILVQDALIKQLDYLKIQLGDAHTESVSARFESRAAREENSLLRREMRSMRDRLQTLEDLIIKHGLTIENGVHNGPTADPLTG